MNAYYYDQQFPGYGVVRETRLIDLAAGRNTVRFTGVAASIDPTTLQFRSFTDPEAAVRSRATSTTCSTRRSCWRSTSASRSR